MASSYQGSRGSYSNTSGLDESPIVPTQPRVGLPTARVTGGVKRSIGEFSEGLRGLVKKHEPPLYFKGYNSNAADRIYYFKELQKVIDEVYKELGEAEAYLKCIVGAQKQLALEAECLGDQTTSPRDNADAVGRKADVSDREVVEKWDEFWKEVELAVDELY